MLLKCSLLFIVELSRAVEDLKNKKNNVYIFIVNDSFLIVQCNTYSRSVYESSDKLVVTSFFDMTS